MSFWKILAFAAGAYLAYEGAKALAPIVTEYVKQLWNRFLHSQRVTEFRQWCLSVFEALAENGYQLSEESDVVTVVDRNTCAAQNVFIVDSENKFVSEEYVVTDAEGADHFLKTSGTVHEIDETTLAFSHMH